MHTQLHKCIYLFWSPFEVCVKACKNAYTIVPGGNSSSSAIWRLLRATAYYSSNMMPIIRDSYLVFICCLLAQAVYFHICYFWLPVSVYTIRSDLSRFRFTSHCTSMLHPQDRIVLTCICRNGITDEIDSRHCIHTCCRIIILRHVCSQRLLIRMRTMRIRWRRFRTSSS